MAGPVISTGALAPAQEMVKVPPWVCTSTTLSSKPSRIPATTAAQVYDPAEPDEAWRLERARRLADSVAADTSTTPAAAR